MPMPQQRLDREEIYEAIVKIIQQSGEEEAEISASDLANTFGVQAPTMDYHIKKIVEEGLLILSDRRGKYNRKIYRLPQNSILQDEPASKFAHIQVQDDKEKKVVQFLDDPTDQYDEEDDPEFENLIRGLKGEEPMEVAQAPAVIAPEEEKFQFNAAEHEAVMQFAEKELGLSKNVHMPVEAGELKLDAKIDAFLEKMHAVPKAEEILEKDDRQILAVMNESIQQAQVYLKDLSDTLSLVQDKTLVQALIDERNKLQVTVDANKNRINDLQEQLLLYQQEAQKKKFDFDPNRVRSMQQVIFNTLDTYLDQPNHSLALSRRDFRNQISKEIYDLVKYVLNLEK